MGDRGRKRILSVRLLAAYFISTFVVHPHVLEDTVDRIRSPAIGINKTVSRHDQYFRHNTGNNLIERADELYYYLPDFCKVRWC